MISRLQTPHTDTYVRAQPSHVSPQRMPGSSGDTSGPAERVKQILILAVSLMNRPS